MRQREHHQVHRREATQRALQRFRLTENFAFIAAGSARRPQQRRHGMPRVALQRPRRRVIAGDDQHVGLQRQQLRQRSIHAFDHLRLGFEIAVFAAAVGVLDVHEEEIVFVPVVGHGLELVFRLAALERDHVHAHETRHTLVHGIDRHARRLQPVGFRETRQLGIRRKAAQRQRIGRAFILQNLARPGDPLIEQLGRMLRIRRLRHGRQRRRFLLWIGIGNVPGQSLTAQNHAEAIILHRFDKDLHAGQRNRAELLHQFHALGSGDASRAPIDNHIVLVDRAKIAARGHVPGAQLEADTHRFQHAAPDHVLQRIVTEQAQMAGAAAGRHAAARRLTQTQIALLSQPIEIGRVGIFQFSRAVQFTRQAAQAIHHQQHDLAVVGTNQFLKQFKICHGFLSQEDFDWGVVDQVVG